MPLHSTPDLRRRIKDRLLALPPRAFELLAGDLLEFIGLQHVEVTRYSGDGGIDAIGSLEANDALLRVAVGVQVKRYRANVQRADIDRFIGALSGRYAQGMFITTGGYSRQAVHKAAHSFPPIATVSGEQVIALMIHHRLGVADGAESQPGLDEAYFTQFELAKRIRDEAQQPLYSADADAQRIARPEDDLISLRALSHALRVDPSVLRRRIEQGLLQPETFPQRSGGGYLFRRDRIAALRNELRAAAHPTDAESWRAEFLVFARSRNLSKSYKPVLLKALFKLVDQNGEAPIDALIGLFRAFYAARRQAGLVVEFGPPDPDRLSDTHLRQLIVKNPLERFLIKGFLEYQAEAGVIRFAPQLWSELRYWELLDVQRELDEQLAYYYRRGSG